MATQKVKDLYERYRKEKKDASADILLNRFPELQASASEPLPEKKEVKKDGKKSKG